jgi:hypothetical protein
MNVFARMIPPAATAGTSKIAAMTPRATAATVVVLGAVVALAGDACHVASGTTHYEWDGVPAIWR